MKITTLTTALLFSLTFANAAFARKPDFKTAQGTVLIAAPTALGGPTNQGVWFIEPSTKEFSLDLPELPTDQVYEGWLLDSCTGIKVSTGLFRSRGGVDSDSAGLYAGPLALDFPSDPGSDFVTLGHDLGDGGHKIVITVEPYPDSDRNPSGTVVLMTEIPSGVMIGTELKMKNVAN